MTDHPAKHQISEPSPNLRSSWIPVRERKIVDSPVMQVIERECYSSEDPNPPDQAKVHRFYLLRSRDWCNVIPVTEDGKVVFVRQFRIGISGHTLEIPGGVTDPVDADPGAAALREMTEETGYEPIAGARCESLGWTYPNPAIQDNRCHSYIVGPVRRAREQKLDPAEMIDVVEVPIEEIPKRIASGEIHHALMLNAFFFLTLRTHGAKDLGDALTEYRRVR